MVPSILTESGIIFGANPDSIFPNVKTPGSCGEISLLTIVCAFDIIWDAATIGSTFK